MYLQVECCKHQSHPIIKVQTLQCGIVCDPMTVVMSLPELVQFIDKIFDMQQSVRAVEVANGLSPGSRPTLTPINIPMFRWVMYTTSGRIIDSSTHWYYSESPARLAGEEARSSRSSRSFSVQVWRKEVPAPTAGHLQEEACCYMLLAGGRAVLGDQCEACQEGEDHGEQHNCEWPHDADQIEKVLSEVELPEVMLRDIVDRSTVILGGRLSPSVPVSYDTTLSSSVAKLMSGYPQPREMSSLFESLELVEASNKSPDLFNV